MKLLKLKLRSKVFASGYFHGFNKGFQSSRKAHIIGERLRVLQELRAKGSAGEFLEIRWTDVIAILDPAEEK